MIRLSSWMSLGLACLTLMVASSDADAAPKKKKKPHTAAASSEAPAPTPELADFDKVAATTAISEISLQKCKATNAIKGDGHVMITFKTDGTAQTAQVDKGPWVGTPVAKCMAKEFKKTKIPPFKGESITVGKTFHFE